MSSLNPGDWPALDGHHSWCDRKHAFRPRCVAVIDRLPEHGVAVVLCALPHGDLEIGLDFGGRLEVFGLPAGERLRLAVAKALRTAWAEQQPLAPEVPHRAGRDPGAP